jgi:hypothetical protein
MKSLRLLALAPFAFACTATLAWACDAPSNAKTAKAGSATTTTTAVVASANGQVPTVAADGGCSAHAMSASAKGSCAAHGASAAGMDHCGMKGASATMAVAGLRCTEHQNGVAHDCSACEDWMQMDKDARSIGAHSQVVALKNGAMIVFTADTPAQVKQLQAMVAKRNERMTAAYAGTSDTKLCDDCKQLRGAIASGKLNREVVNVEHGVMALVTSNDRQVVQRIRNMTGQPIAMK